MAEHNDLGKWGEQYVEAFLRRKGYIILERDWRHGRSLCDIDLICKTADETTIVFVEVKTRSADDITLPEDAVTLNKMRRLGHSADNYVKMNDITEDLRFDIVALVGNSNDEEPQINHIEDAFNPLLI
ncbi:MAG: YraN family protein [Prevotella sp.]|nr:YraN family protein [Prevotella sp.]